MLIRIGFELRQVNSGRYNVTTYTDRIVAGRCKIAHALNSSVLLSQGEWDVIADELPEIANRIAWIERNVIVGGNGVKKSVAPQTDGNDALRDWLNTGSFMDTSSLKLFSATERYGYPGDWDIVFAVKSLRG